MLIKEIKDSIIQYLLQLADNALILGHRNSEWCGHGPILEQDIALTNIALDQLGQARNFYQYAASLINEKYGATETEDSLAYHRDCGDFKNCLLVELPNGDWGQTILRQSLVSVLQFHVYSALENEPDQQLAAIAAKSLKEIRYHLSWSKDWVIRLGDGTEESKNRMQQALENIWPYTNELITFNKEELDFIGNEAARIKEQWKEDVNALLSTAGLTIPVDGWMQKGGKQGIHTEHLGYLLAEMQFLQRAYPGAEW